MKSSIHPASLRDPAGYVIKHGDCLYRVIRPDYCDEYRALLSTSLISEQCNNRNLPSFRILQVDEAIELLGPEVANCICLEHEVISFPSYPSEWPVEMLCAAAELTINLCIQAITYGIGLKDATPFNVLFRGPSPVFVDLLSFEYRIDGDPTWLANSQFVRSFLLPSLIDLHFNIPSHSIYWSHRDGVEPEEVFFMLSPLSRLSFPFLEHVTIPVLLSKRADRSSNELYKKKVLSNTEQARYVLNALFSRLMRITKTSSRRKRLVNHWVSYNDTCTYSSESFLLKSVFIEEFLQLAQPKKVLDIGCNTGHFSFIAANYGAEVVATDLDPEVVGKLWVRAFAEKANILPLVINLARPTPSQGWRNLETPSFLERAEGYFDGVLMLAVVHHLLVADQIPLDNILFQASKLTKQWLVIEYVGPKDPQFIRLLRGRDVLYDWLDRYVFESKICELFEIVRKKEIGDTDRWLYLARRKDDH